MWRPHLKTADVERRIDAAAPVARLQLLLVDCCLLFAVALLVNRDKLPLWMQPRHPSHITISVYQHEILEAMMEIPVHEFAGHDTLLVGDSIIWQHPWRSDKISFPAMSPTLLLLKMKRLLPGRHYAVIIIWSGTALITDDDLEGRYIEPTAQIVQLAHAHADRVVVIAPMPVLNHQAGFSMGNAVTNIDAAARLSRHALQALRARLPDEQIVDTELFVRATISQGKFSTYSIDGVHLSLRGFEAFRQYLMEQSQPVVLHPRKAAEQTVPGPTATLRRSSALVPVT